MERMVRTAKVQGERAGTKVKSRRKSTQMLHVAGLCNKCILAFGAKGGLGEGAHGRIASTDR